MVRNCEKCSPNHQKSNVVSGVCNKCATIIIAYNRYYEANIPLEYWNLKMSSSFPEDLFTYYNNYTKDLAKVYDNGQSVCLCGSHGIGKTTLLTNILKKACQKNYSCSYITLSDMVNVLTYAGSEDKFYAKRLLSTIDFLAVDEFDSRYVQSENAANLFGNVIEHILRTRMQNKLPTILASNSPNPIETFNGSIKQSIESLMSKVKLISVIGKDYRKIQGNI